MYFPFLVSQGTVVTCTLATWLLIINQNLKLHPPVASMAPNTVVLSVTRQVGKMLRALETAVFESTTQCLWGILGRLGPMGVWVIAGDWREHPVLWNFEEADLYLPPDNSELLLL